MVARMVLALMRISVYWPLGPPPGAPLAPDAFSDFFFFFFSATSSSSASIPCCSWLKWASGITLEELLEALGEAAAGLTLTSLLENTLYGLVELLLLLVVLVLLLAEFLLLSLSSAGVA